MYRREFLREIAGRLTRCGPDFPDVASVVHAFECFRDLARSELDALAASLGLESMVLVGVQRVAAWVARLRQLITEKGWPLDRASVLRIVQAYRNASPESPDGEILIAAQLVLRKSRL